MKSPYELLLEFGDFGSRVAFSTVDGVNYEGYFLNLSEDEIEFGCGGPLSSDEPVSIPLDSIDLSTLAFFDKERQRYRTAIWNEGAAKWEFTDT